MQKIDKLTPLILDSLDSMRPFMYRVGIAALKQWCKANNKSAVLHKKADGYTICYIRSTGRIC